MKLTGFAVLFALVAAVPVRAQCPTRAYWPTDGWQSRVSEVATHRADAIAALESYAFTLKGEDKERLGIRTDGVVIIKNGDLIYEKYARGYDETKRHPIWSSTKTMANALFGIGVREGFVSPDDSICKHVTLADSAYCDIKMEHLLSWGSGIDWMETYEGADLRSSSVLAMLYGVGHADMVAFVSSHRFRDAPGTSWMYSSGDTTLLCGVIAPPFVERYGEEWPWPVLFEPLGMDSVSFEHDSKGVYVGSSYVYVTPRDAAKFGYLYLNDGCWDGSRILPDGWVAQSTSVSASFKTERLLLEEDDVGGWQWWLNVAVPELGIEKPWPNAPDDLYAARGHWGQYIFVIPSLDIVAVRVGDDRDGAFEIDEFLKPVIEVAQ